MSPTRLPALALSVSLAVCVAEGCLSQGSLSAGWPEWQRIEAGEPPLAWQVQEASFAFDAWEASTVVARISSGVEASTIRFEDRDGRALDVRLASLPTDASGPALQEGDTVRMALIRRQGFEGVAQALTVYGGDGRLLLLYDDGGYGPGIYEDGARGGVGVDRALRGTGAGGGWESPAVTFSLEGESVTCDEGASVRLAGTGLAVSVVVSREWTGEPVTDADLSPLAYFIFRVR